MTKGNVENDVEELSEEVLGDLSHDERLELFLEASAKGKDGWRERLAETAPQATYEQMKVGLTRRVEIAYAVGQTATIHLQRSALRYLWVSSAYEYSTQVSLLDEELPPHPLVSMEDVHPLDFLEAVYIWSEAYRRFANDDLGVALETWLSEVPEGARILDTVDAILESEADQLRRWQGDGEPLPIPAMNSPDEFDAVIEDRYAIVSQHYRDVLMFEGAGRAFGCKGAGSLCWRGPRNDRRRSIGCSPRG